VGKARFWLVQEGGAIGEEFWSEARGLSVHAGNVIDGIASEGGVRPVFQPGQNGALGGDIGSRVDRRLGKAALKFFADPFRVTKDIGPDLESGGAAVAPGEGQVIRFGQDRRNVDRPPGQALEPQDQADLLGIIGEVVVVKNQFCRHLLSLVR